eukprot:TRINITY_DN12610_c0_g1_i4.p1 TRINITY_DN12610_c0_g1~~TRINITY_DN12610_c0_g1_i4.p1  ORF type:complete len:148 (-),score=12.49 TRINITY_DN12610_c0_g1_i4:179-622(-)
MSNECTTHIGLGDDSLRQQCNTICKRTAVDQWDIVQCVASFLSFSQQVMLHTPMIDHRQRCSTGVTTLAQEVSSVHLQVLGQLVFGLRTVERQDLDFHQTSILHKAIDVIPTKMAQVSGYSFMHCSMRSLSSHSRAVFSMTGTTNVS